MVVMVLGGGGDEVVVVEWLAVFQAWQNYILKKWSYIYLQIFNFYLFFLAFYFFIYCKKPNYTLKHQLYTLICFSFFLKRGFQVWVFFV